MLFCSVLLIGREQILLRTVVYPPKAYRHAVTRKTLHNMASVTECICAPSVRQQISRVGFKAMCHTDVEAPMVTNWFPYFLPASLLFGSKRSKLLFSYLLPTITCFALSRKTYWFGEIRETDSLPSELQRRYATLP